MESKYKKTYELLCNDTKIKTQLDDYHLNNILEALLFADEHKINHSYKVGQKIEFTQIGMEPLLHGKITKIYPTYVEVKCKNRCRRYPSIKEIIRVMEE